MLFTWQTRPLPLAIKLLTLASFLVLLGRWLKFALCEKWRKREKGRMVVYKREKLKQERKEGRKEGRKDRMERWKAE